MYLLSRGSGYPILFLHGLPTSSKLWNGVVARMDSQFTCLAVDLPGLGRTASTPSGIRDLKSIVDTLELIRVEQCIDRWHLVGHDAGCAIAVHYAHRHKERVGRLALLTPSIFPELKPFYLFEILRRRVVGELMAPFINLLFWNVVMRLALGGRKERQEVVSDFRAPFKGIHGAWRLMALLRWGKPAEVLASIPALLPNLLLPTLIFHGSNDPAVPKDFALRASQLIPDSEVVLLDSGHFLPLSDPEVIADELSRFFVQNQISEMDCAEVAVTGCA
jgi:pimeloyl-ACP methyl ester carboxylesterase